MKPRSSSFSPMYVLTLVTWSNFDLTPASQIDPSAGYKGITCFVATKDMGIEIAKKEQKLGIRASSTCTLNFDDLKVPAENIIGGEGKGYKIAIEILNEGSCDVRLLVVLWSTNFLLYVFAKWQAVSVSQHKCLVLLKVLSTNLSRTPTNASSLDNPLEPSRACPSRLPKLPYS